MVKFADGHTAMMADAYFEVDPNAKKQNSASITLRSELEQPKPAAPAKARAEVKPQAPVQLGEQVERIALSKAASGEATASPT